MCIRDRYYTPFETLDKNNNADYPILANGKSGSTAYLEGDSLPVGNQEWNQEYSPSYAVFNVENNRISVKVYNLAGDQTNPDSKEIDAFTVTKNSDGGEKTTGYENNSALLALEQSARYDSGTTNSDGGCLLYTSFCKAILFGTNSPKIKVIKEIKIVIKTTAIVSA